MKRSHGFGATPRALLAAMVGLFLLHAAPAGAVTAEGSGASPAQALNAALRRAVEQTIGVDVQGVTVVGNMQTIRDEVLSHAQGYVSRYRVVGERSDGGRHVVTIDAEVNAGRIRSHFEALDILMMMAGRPKLAVIGIDDGIESVSPIVPDFAALIASVRDIFRDNFRFAVIDGGRAKGANRAGAIAQAVKQGADYVVLVRLDALPTRQGRLARAELILEGVRAADSSLLGAQSVDVHAPLYRDEGAAAFTVRGHVFPLAVELAQAVVDDVQNETMGGGGARFTLAFLDLPGEVADTLRDEVRYMAGYVRHRVTRQVPGVLEVAYWSRLRNDELTDEIRKLLAEKHLTYRFRVEGRVLKFKNVDPYFD